MNEPAPEPEPVRKKSNTLLISGTGSGSGSFTNQMNTPLRISKISEESPLQASKWLSYQVIIDATEMASLLDSLGEFYIYAIGSVVPIGSEQISKETFLQNYSNYISSLQQGIMPDESVFRRLFATVFTTTPEALFAIRVDDRNYLVRVAKPVIQLQAHRMDYSKEEGKFRSMTFGGDSLTWGLQFAYPQLYQDGKTKEIFPVDSSANCPNTPLFRSLQLWVRNNTTPTQFLVDDKKINVPVRIGKNCLSWINNHPQLAKKGLTVV